MRLYPNLGYFGQVIFHFNLTEVEKILKYPSLNLLSDSKPGPTCLRAHCVDPEFFLILSTADKIQLQDPPPERTLADIFFADNPPPQPRRSKRLSS